MVVCCLYTSYPARRKLCNSNLFSRVEGVVQARRTTFVLGTWAVLSGLNPMRAQN